MNEKLKKIRDGLAFEYAEYTKYKKVGLMLTPKKAIEREKIYNYCNEAFLKGFTAAIPHIRRDEREKVLIAIRKTCIFTRSNNELAEFLEEELKKMDEVNDER